MSDPSSDLLPTELDLILAGIRAREATLVESHRKAKEDENLKIMAEARVFVASAMRTLTEVIDSAPGEDVVVLIVKGPAGFQAARLLLEMAVQAKLQFMFVRVGEERRVVYLPPGKSPRSTWADVPTPLALETP